ncbi:hypothetical protein IEQ34_021020 [Dendrobium chrysotoxum]|uniref:Uncharacterized protein n=1 Tax=Dendrobium chrysotoxum TaxID=161865 RepID=A0AAV7G3S4_DENCH|nr:hypothetical protein IEQ34_021020 [Dendrobium chrysotoxum]
MIKRLITSHVLLINYVPDSCIINIYEPSDFILPQIDHDFVRLFSTVSFLRESNIMFVHNKICWTGYVLVLNDNGADITKHCIPAVSFKRIFVTFRKMDKVKRPYNFKLDSNLQNIKSFDLSDASESYHNIKGCLYKTINDIVIHYDICLVIIKKNLDVVVVELSKDLT